MAERVVVGSGYVSKITGEVFKLGAVGVGAYPVAEFIEAAKQMVDFPNDVVYWIETLDHPARAPQVPWYLL